MPILFAVCASKEYYFTALYFAVRKFLNFIYMYPAAMERRTLMDLWRGMCGYNRFDMNTITITYVAVCRDTYLLRCCRYQ